MTGRLYYDDAYLAEFDARIVDADPERRRVYLDRTAFYPTSGGQPFDVGEINGVAVQDVVDEEDRVAHLLAGPVESDSVNCRIDWTRRFDHMQQHSGQHLLSAVLVEHFGMPTVSFHLGEDACTIDVEAAAFEPSVLREAERRANEVVCQDRPILVTYEDAAAVTDLRKASDRTGVLRIVSIENLDRIACGGTHVRRTGEIGPVLLRKTEKIRGNVRIEFLCGNRALRRARADYDALTQIAKVLSSTLDEAPALVAAQMEKAKDLDKALRRSAVELAQHKGRELYAAVAPGPDGIRRHFCEAPLDDSLRALAQTFTGQPRALLIALSKDPPAALVAASADSGIHAGNTLKQALAACGGRGGGSPLLAQGSVPSPDALPNLRAELQRLIP